MTSGDVRPDRHALLELEALLDELVQVRHDGDRGRFDVDHRFRWLLHRIWIAVGNEAYAYARLTGRDLERDRPWSGLYQLRNRLAHRRLPDIDEDEVWRMTQFRPEPLREQIRELLR